MTPLRILIVEDSANDALLLERELRRSGLNVTCLRVETPEEMKAALETNSWDVVISDFALPRFDAPAALHVLNETGLDLPFIIVSGTVGEEVAVEAMKAGAHDYILKGNLTRLVPALLREIEQAAHRGARRQLEAEREKLLHAVENSPASVVITDANGSIEYVNPKFTRVTGYSSDEVLGRNPKILKSGELPPEIYQDLWQTITAGREWRGEFHNRKKNGELFWESASISPVFDERKRITNFIGVKEDITERKQAEETLRESEKRYRSLFESMFHGYAHCEMVFENGEPQDFVYLDVNRAFEELTGLRNVVGRRVTEVIPGIRESAPELLSMYGRVAKTGDPERFEVYLDGLGNWFSISAYSPQKGHFVAVFDNITERKRAEEALVRRERHFRSLIENAQDIITIIDMESIIRFQSPAATQILGRPPEEFVGRSAFEFVHPDDAPVVRDAIGRAVARPESAQTSQFRFRHANGSWRTMEGIGKVLPGEGPAQIVVNSRDVTEGRALEDQLRQSQKMEAVGRLAGGIAHDFNNLLTAIMGYAELAAGRLKPEDPTRSELSEIDKASRRAAELTGQLLAFSRKQVLQPRVVSLNQVVSDMDKMLRRVIGEDVDLVTSLKEPLGSVKADTGQLGQVLLNLAINSRDAMPNGGKLTIETSDVELDETYSAFHFDVPPGRYLLLAVSDTGTGMDAKTLSHIFEPFFTTKGVGKGTGLGLSTVYGVVKQSGGHVTVYSEPGVGTTVKVYLPRVEDAQKDAAPSTGRAHQAGGTETVLVVEDEEAVRRLVCRSLEARGYETLPAASANEALLALEKHPGEIHLMLTDVVMPILSGRELAERLAALRPRMKVLFMSGYTDDAIVHHGVLEAGTPFIQKPFTPHTLAAKVREVLDAPGKSPAA